MIFCPRIVFWDIQNQGTEKLYVQKINTVLETTLIKEFVKNIQVGGDTGFGDLNSLMRTLKGNDNFKLPGDDGAGNYYFINIIITEKEDNSEIVELLNNI